MLKTNKNLINLKLQSKSFKIEFISNEFEVCIIEAMLHSRLKGIDFFFF